MKLPLFSHIREAAQHLLSKGPAAATAAIQQALNGKHRAAANHAPAAMRDINPPPGGAAPAARASIPSQAEPVLEGEPKQASPEARASVSTPEAEPEAASPASPSEQVGATERPNPATHPTEYAQDVLNRMGIRIDLQANIDGAMPAGFEMPKFDLSGLDLAGFKSPSTPPAELAEGAQFLSASYANHAGSRNYKLYIPSNYHGQAMPLLVMLHGCTQNPDDFAAGTQMNQVAEEQQCFVVYPEQTQGANNSKCWNWFNAIDQQRGQGEPSIIAGIAQQIIDEYPVNERQVYVAGLSAGGAMAVIVGTLYPELFAAVGVHSGLPFASAQDLPSALSAMKRGVSQPHKAGNGSLPIIVFHGDRDTTVNPRNGEQVMEQGLHSLQGRTEPSVQSGSVPNGHRYTQTTHRKADGSPIGEHWVVHGAGHAWSGGSTRGSYTDGKGPDASREMVRFFSTVS